MSRMKNKNNFFKLGSMTIARKITILYGGIFSVSLLIVSLLVLFNASMIQQNITKRELLQTVDNIEKFIRNGGKMSEDTLRTLLENKYVEVNVIDLKYRQFYKSAVGDLPSFMSGPPPEGFKNKENQSDSEQVAEDQTGETLQDGQLHPESLMEKGYKIYEKRPNQIDSKEYIIDNGPGQEIMLIEKRINTDQYHFVVQCFKMVTKDHFYVQSFATRMLLIDVVGILCAILIGSYISRRILKPVAEIRSTAERISIEDLSQRISTDGPDDEMKELTVTFNSMIARLEDSFKKQNQFISDASHELRTPIAVIQGYANLINRWGKSDPTVLQESIDSIRGETEHMSDLIRKLLFLAKSDQSMLHVQKERLNLNETVSEIVRELEIMEVKKNITVEEHETIEIFADGALIKQLLWIHTENALKYTKDDGSIHFVIGRDGRFGFVSIMDDGPGVKPEDVPFLFDRFYRADKSRNKGIPGTGLGLSIAHWIAECHGGKITVDSGHQGGAIFTNTFLLYESKEGKEGLT